MGIKKNQIKMSAEAEQPQYKLDYRGFLQGHNGWVTCLKVGEEEISKDTYREFLLSGSRDQTLMVWDLAERAEGDEDKELGKARKILTGHSHFISDVDISQDSRFCLSSSWDGTIRLWNLKTAQTRKTLIGHSKDVLSVAFSPDNRQIASGSVDKNLKIWDNSVMALKHTFVGHKAQINTLDLAPNTNFIASGGRDGKVNIWNLVEGRHLEEIDAESPVNVVLFASKLYWLVIGTEQGIKVYDLPNKKFIDRYEATSLDGKDRRAAQIGCTSLVWSKNQQSLYAGFTDGFIRVLQVVNAQS